MNDKHRVLIVEGHSLLRAGLWALLAKEADLEVVGEAGTGREALRLLGQLLPHLVLIDITPPCVSDTDIISDFKQRLPTVKVLVLTHVQTDRSIQESLAAGADGYLLKGATQDELRLAIRTLLRGKAYLTPEISAQLINGYLGVGQRHPERTPWDCLTRRERQVLKLIAEGHPSKLIAQYLCLSVKTVDKHRSNLMSKLDIHKASRLTGFAFEHGLLSGHAQRPGLSS